MAVEKLLRAKFAKIELRQDALQTTFSIFLDIFYPPNFRRFDENGVFQHPRDSSTVTPDPVLALFLLAFKDHMICYWLHYCGDSNPTLRKLLLAREMVHHIRVLAILPPSPAFRDVVPIFKVQHHIVLMPNRDAGEIAGA